MRTSWFSLRPSPCVYKRALPSRRPPLHSTHALPLLACRHLLVSNCTMPPSPSTQIDAHPASLRTCIEVFMLLRKLTTIPKCICGPNDREVILHNVDKPEHKHVACTGCGAQGSDVRAFCVPELLGRTFYKVCSRAHSLPKITRDADQDSKCKKCEEEFPNLPNHVKDSPECGAHYRE